MRRSSKHIWNLSASCVLLIWLTGCTFATQPPTLSPEPNPALLSVDVTPTDGFANRKNSFGDGYIAHVSLKDVEGISQKEIVNLLVSQWLEHYKTESADPDAAITDYAVDEITLAERRSENDPSIMAWGKFSIIPVQTPNLWASFSGDPIKPDEPWWHLEILFGVNDDQPEFEYYWLRIMTLG